ncbi:MAG: hypothetical protein H6700_12955 [Myxococcales bacterium]|nr:hypothetical protein [Myxococcales bacterium]
MHRPLSLPLALASVFALAACSDDPSEPQAEADASTSDDADAASSSDADADVGVDAISDEPDGGEDADAADADTSPVDTCGEATPLAFDAVGPYGLRRHDLADDFSVTLLDGSTWTLSEEWTGCDSYVFLPDTLTLSSADSTSLWEQGVDDLVAASPPNAHYFFISRRPTASAASAVLEAMQARIDASVGAMDAGDAAWWGSHLHVVATVAAATDAWVGDAVDRGVGQLGLAIDRAQRIRGVGSLADVDRYNAALEFPWDSSLAYAANEVRYYNFEANRQARLDAVDATEVHFWQGEVIEQFADMEVELPPAADFDTLELDVTQWCPNPNALEAGNCGAWDYLAYLWLYVDDETRVELGRHITTYHREGRWIVDITPALALLQEGGVRKFRWEWAPEWNVQPTATWLTLRYSNQGKGYRPTQLVPLFTGGAFGETYNDGRTLAHVAIPESAAHVELWAIITGHGAETNQCAEFCNHQHEFIVNGRSFYREHPMVGNQHSCMEQIEQGAVPNQWGTWWFGRGGWCPGMQVDPFVVDITDLAPAGTVADVDYFGWFEGRTPPANSGNIALTSFVTVYE